MSETVSAKVPKGMKARARSHDIEISSLLRRALEEEVARAEEKELRKSLAEASSRLRGRVSVGDVVRVVRETREEK